MGEQRQDRRNLVQNILITLLALSAAVLFTQTQLYNLNLTTSEAPSGPAQSAAPAAELAAPVRTAVTGDYGRCGGLTCTTGDPVFADPLGRRLLEALGSARDYAPCSRGDFLRALRGPSLYYDFLEPLPLSVLAGLLGGGEDVSPREDLSARRLLIVPQEGGAVLYLWDGGENCFRASTAVSSDSLEQVISRYELGDASFAMDGGGLERELDPCSLLPAQPPELPSFTLGDPLAGGTDWLLSALGFNPRSRTRHTESSGTELIIDGDRTLRIRPDNTIHYQSGNEPILRVKAAGDLPTAREAALGAGSLLSSLLAPVSGELQPWLQSLRRSGDVTALRFGYQLKGVPVRFQDGGFAAEITLTGSAVTALSLRFRQYNAAEEPSLLLPLPQALAVAAASPGKELSIGYVERGGECRAYWLSD
ncbi:hypothetical protein [Oscillibacter sp.]|jgi:hypothetical protein|uniref:hypothetical protein n=1 Tax=Oscillibacter sp. TaxID=1945593 RepID=UPI0021715732|nr:hypothetical protein [Oscillibacter sp.]MCI9241073.1 hypothetical protein [Oscillibacter sp.]